MRLWQKTMIALARSERMIGAMQGSGLMNSFSRRFVGGASRQAGVECASGLRGRGVDASMFYLGEYVDDLDLVKRNVQELAGVIPELSTAGLDAHVSVDPTQVGSMVSWDLCRENVTALAELVSEHAGSGCSAVMLDMEDSSVTQRTIDLYYELRSRSLPVAVTIQAYLRRSGEDVRRLVDAGAMVRLVKGAFAEPGDIAFTSGNDVDKAYLDCVGRLFSVEARNKGVRPVLGTHDGRMVDFALDLAEANGWQRDMWEVEMLYTESGPDTSANWWNRACPCVSICPLARAGGPIRSGVWARVPGIFCSSCVPSSYVTSEKLRPGPSQAYLSVAASFRARPSNTVPAILFMIFWNPWDRLSHWPMLPARSAMLPNTIMVAMMKTPPSTSI